MNALNISERTMNPLGTGSGRDIRQRLAPLPSGGVGQFLVGDFVKPCQIWTHDADFLSVPIPPDGGRLVQGNRLRR